MGHWSRGARPGYSRHLPRTGEVYLEVVQVLPEVVHTYQYSCTWLCQSEGLKDKRRDSICQGDVENEVIAHSDLPLKDDDRPPSSPLFFSHVICIWIFEQLRSVFSVMKPHNDTQPGGMCNRQLCTRENAVS